MDTLGEKVAAITDERLEYPQGRLRLPSSPR